MGKGRSACVASVSRFRGGVCSAGFESGIAGLKECCPLLGMQLKCVVKCSNFALR